MEKRDKNGRWDRRMKETQYLGRCTENGRIVENCNVQATEGKAQMKIRYSRRVSVRRVENVRRTKFGLDLSKRKESGEEKEDSSFG